MESFKKDKLPKLSSLWKDIDDVSSSDGSISLLGDVLLSFVTLIFSYLVSDSSLVVTKSSFSSTVSFSCLLSVLLSDALEGCYIKDEFTTDDMGTLTEIGGSLIAKKVLFCWSK